MWSEAAGRGRHVLQRFGRAVSMKTSTRNIKGSNSAAKFDR